MTTPPPPHAPRDPGHLDDGERALAARLAKLGPHGTADTRLDTRILSAAADALAREQAAAHAPRRWPWALGIAASVVLAIGLAWRLRPPPVPTGTPLPTATTPAASDALGTTATARDAAEDRRNSDRREPPVTAAPKALTAPAPNAAATAAIEVGEAPAAPAAPALAELAPITTQGTPITPPTARARAAAPPAVVANDATPAPPPPPAPAERAGHAASSNPAGTVEAAASAGLPNSRDAGDEPPATADQPGVQATWLARIRQLRAAGKADAARDSLAEFRRRYPDTPLPADLATWWAEVAPPAP